MKHNTNDVDTDFSKESKQENESFSLSHAEHNHRKKIRITIEMMINVRWVAWFRFLCHLISIKSMILALKTVPD